MTDDLLRLSKLMAQRGICSRREADQFIQDGAVKVNGVIIDQLGTKVAPDVKIEISPRAKRMQESLVTIILNKPIGFVSAQPEPGYQPAITLINQANQFIDATHTYRKLVPNHLRGLAVAGRLDIDSQGLLVFTQDGRLAKRIIGENSEIEKEYLVRVNAIVREEVLAQLRFGLSLDGKPLKRAIVEQVNPEQLRFVLREGKKRQIRRMCEMVGLRVLGLKRVRIGRLRLRNLPEGKWRFLEPDEQL